MFSHNAMNYTGKVGLILCPNAMDSITFASPSDAGSQIDPNNPGRRSSGLPPATPQLIQAAIDERLYDAYNELGVLNYRVLGVFIDPPVQYSLGEGIVSIEYSEVASAFPDQPLFCIYRGELFGVVQDNAGYSIGAKADVQSALCMFRTSAIMSNHGFNRTPVSSTAPKPIGAQWRRRLAKMLVRRIIDHNF